MYAKHVNVEIICLLTLTLLCMRKKEIHPQKISSFTLRRTCSKISTRILLGGVIDGVFFGRGVTLLYLVIFIFELHFEPH